MIAIVRRPSPRLAEGEVTYVERRTVNLELALAQWHAYVAALGAAGWEVVEAPSADDCPDGVFVEDVLAVFDDVAVITRPGAESRRAEIGGVESVAAELGLRIEHIHDPGTLDGGDILKVNDTVHVGVGGRTNAEGMRQLRAIVEPLGKTVKEVALGKTLHLKSAMTALPDGAMIDGNVLDLGGGNVLTARASVAEKIAARGFEPVLIDISEFEKLEGDVTCLSVRIRSTI